MRTFGALALEHTIDGLDPFPGFLRIDVRFHVHGGLLLATMSLRRRDVRTNGPAVDGGRRVKSKVRGFAARMRSVYCLRYHAHASIFKRLPRPVPHRYILRRSNHAPQA